MGVSQATRSATCLKTQILLGQRLPVGLTGALGADRILGAVAVCRRNVYLA